METIGKTLKHSAKLAFVPANCCPGSDALQRILLRPRDVRDTHACVHVCMHGMHVYECVCMQSPSPSL